jgi:hypothetical protein
MAGSSDKSIALDAENVRDIGATYTVGYSNATGRQKLRSPASAPGSDQPNDGLAAELQSCAICRFLAQSVGSLRRSDTSVVGVEADMPTSLKRRD